MEFRHESDKNRFVVQEGERSGLLEYRRLDERTLAYAHTYVAPEHRGGGIASRLVLFALDYARDHGLAVVPSCPFVARLMDAHPEYESIRADGPTAG